MKKTIIISALATAFLVTGCSNNNINSTMDAYNYLTEDVDNETNLNIKLLKNKFKNLKFKDVTSNEIPKTDTKNIKDYSAYRFSNAEGSLTIFLEKDNLIAINNENAKDNSDSFIQYITNENIEEILSTYKDSNSLRVREKSNIFEEQEELIDIMDKKINSNSLLKYKELVNSLTENPKLTLKDIEKLLDKEAVFSENTKVNNIKTKLYTFENDDSIISVYLNSNNLVQCVIADNLAKEHDKTMTAYMYEFNPYLSETRFVTSIYYVNAPEKVEKLNKDTVEVLK